jgi:hypothetical protein
MEISEELRRRGDKSSYIPLTKTRELSDDLPVLDESRHRHRPNRNMAGANRISGYDGRLWPP